MIIKKNLKKGVEIIVILDNIRSMHNIGSIFRTCDAIGNCSIVLCGISGTPPHKEIHKTALGSTNYVKWKYEESTEKAILKLKKKKYNIIAVEQNNLSTSLNDFNTKSKLIALVFGNEVNGISNKIIEICDSSIEINQYGLKKSMNVSVAAGIVLWTITNK